MSHPNPIQVELISDDEDDNVTSNSLKTPVSNHLKRPRSDFHSNSAPFFIIDDDPTPQKLRTSASSARSAVSEISFSDSPKTQDPQTLSCESKDVKDPSFGSSSLPRISTVGGLICLESDDENEKCPERGNWWKNIGRFAGFDEEKDLKASPRFAIRDKQWQNGEISAGFDEENNLEKSSADIDSVHYTDVAVHSNVHDDAEGSPAKGIGLRNEGRSDLNVQDYSAKKPDIALKESRKRKEVINADFDVECLEESLSVVKSSSLENRKPTSTYESIHLEDDADQLLPFHDLDHGTENVRLEADGVNCKRKSRGNANPQLKQNRNEKLTNRKKSEAEKARVMGEKKLKKQQDQLHKVALKAEAAKSRQLEKDKQRWEKECDKNILTEIDPKVLQCGSIGGLRFNITSNPVEKSIIWRMNIPEELSQLASLETDVHYVLLIYGAEEFCKVALDGSLMDHISSVRNHYPSYTICCLTNRLMSYINKRLFNSLVLLREEVNCISNFHQEIASLYNLFQLAENRLVLTLGNRTNIKMKKNGSDWERPPVEEVFAKFHFAKVHTRQCADEAELADHVVGLTINLAKCRFRKKLTPIFVNANECNVPKDCVDRDLILKNTWLKMLVAIPKVQPIFAIAIWKKYPTMKSLLSVYMDPNKSVDEKESMLKDLMAEGPLGNEERRAGEICSKRIYRIFMAQNGYIDTDEVENGADYFTANLNSDGKEQVISRSVLFLCESPVCV